MQTFIFTVLDTKAKAFMMPFFAINNAVAFRQCETTCKQPNSNFSQHPADYILVKIGEYDDSTGIINAFPSYENLGNFLQFLPPPAPPANDGQLQLPVMSALPGTQN